MSLLQPALTRFKTLYPLLSKQKAKSSQAGQVAAFNASQSKSETKLDVNKLLAFKERIKIISTVAKSEVESLSEQERNGLLAEVTEIADQLCQVPVQIGKATYEVKEYFIFCLFAQLARATSQPHFTTDLMLNMVVRSQHYLNAKASQLQGNEDAAQLEVSLKRDDELASQLDFIEFLLCKSIIKSASSPQTLQILTAASASLSQFATQPHGEHLAACATATIWCQVLQIMFRKNDQIAKDAQYQATLKQLLDIVFDVLEIHKQNSKYYLTKVGEAVDGDARQLKRASNLYTEILDLLVSFIVSYLTTSLVHTSEHTQRLFTLLFLEQEESQFTLSEQLNVLKQLNSLFYHIPAIQESGKYWQLVRQGLEEIDQSCRKVALHVLKENLNFFSEARQKGLKLHCSDKEFEQLWTTFFDVFDTLESFGSHLIKAIWHRMDAFYDFIRDHKDQIGTSDAHGQYTQNSLLVLEDFRMWLYVMYNRVSNHANLKIRKFVTKATLKRPFITEQMREFYFGEFLALLNQGHIFKDNKTIYTQFTKNSEQVHNFFSQYFAHESANPAADLRMLLVGMSKTASHHQMFLICLRLLATKFGQGRLQFIGQPEMLILEKIFNSNFTDLIFGNKYLCKKFTLQLLANYLIVPDETFDWRLLFKLLGQMHAEFFSTRTIFVDNEALDASARLLEVLGKQRLQTAISDYLTCLFTVKALHTQMPKFGTNYEAVIKGIASAVMVTQLVYQEPVIFWFLQTLETSLLTFDQMIESTYLSNQLIESKVHCLEILMSHLYSYANEPFVQQIRNSNFKNRVGPILSRIHSNLISPLASKEPLPSETDKIQASYGNLRSYSRFLNLSIRMIHLHGQTSHNALQSFIKTLLTESLKLTQSRTEDTWGTYLQQHVLFSLLAAMFEAYAKGITESIKNGADHFFVPDEVFQFGQPLLQNLVSFKPQLKTEMIQEHTNFLLDQDTTLLKINQNVLINCWRCIADIVHIFQFDPTLKQELQQVTNNSITEKALDFLTDSTEEYNQSLFKILKMSYLHIVINNLQTLKDVSDIRQAFEQLQQVFMTCWKIVKDLRTDIDAETLQQFVELVFAPELLESYYIHSDNTDLHKSLIAFHLRLAEEVIEHSNSYWLILRGFFNHLMFMFATKPWLMRSFEPFIYNFAMARELRSLDAQLKFYKLQTMLPQAIPKPYENLSLDQITFQGAYVRTLTLIIVEGVIHQHLSTLKAELAQGVLSPQTEQTMDSLEKLMRETMLLNFNSKKMRKVEMPYGEGHRMKLRNWCFLIVLLQMLDPAVYTEEFRRHRLEQGHGDIVADVLKYSWEAIKQNSLASIRQYIEVFIIKFILKFPDLCLSDPSFFTILLDPKVTRPQISSSLLLIVGVILISPLQSANAVAFKKKIFDHLLAFTVSNSAHSRCIAQYFIVKLQDDAQFGKAFMPSAIQPILTYLNDSKDAQQLLDKYEEKTFKFHQLFLAQDGARLVLSCELDKEGEFITESFVEALRNITTETICAMRKEDQRPPDRKDYWKYELERRLQEDNLQLNIPEEVSTNYQRKILPWEQMEVSLYHLQREQLGQTLQQRESQRRRNEIIMCASLIDKIPNLAGLARTSEIMNASSLLVDQASVCQNDEFKSIAVTSEKWLPIYEVKEKNLLSYLQYQKSNGYVILGLEQTANSKMLHEFVFPSKCILVLGKEKEGIPQEYYGILDDCIEIPQFGIIRSLNVHVSGALCLWEYTKQMVQNKK